MFKNLSKKTLLIIVIVVCITKTLYAQNANKSVNTIKDSIQLIYPFNDKSIFVESDPSEKSKLYLKKPNTLKQNIEFDSENGLYIFTEKIGEIEYRLPKAMTLSEYMKYDMDRAVAKYWRQRNSEQDELHRYGVIPSIVVENESFSKVFGGSTINIKPQGFIEATTKYTIDKTNNPSIPEKNRKIGTLEFDQQIQMSLNGKIGEKLNLRANYNSTSTFSFENQINLKYSGNEDEIIKNIEAGNVSMPLESSLISGATNRLE